MMDEWLSFIQQELRDKHKSEWDETDWDSYYHLVSLGLLDPQ